MGISQVSRQKSLCPCCTRRQSLFLPDDCIGSGRPIGCTMPFHRNFSSCAHFRESLGISQVPRQMSPFSLLRTSAVTFPAGRLHSLSAACCLHMALHRAFSSFKHMRGCKGMRRRQAAVRQYSRPARRVTADVYSKEIGDFCQETCEMPFTSWKYSHELEAREGRVQRHVQAAVRRQPVESFSRESDSGRVQ